MKNGAFLDIVYIERMITMTKKAFFYIDDVIWVFRDIAREKPASIFDNSFMKMLKTAHDNYGMKTQLNIFFKTDNFYGNDEFSLKEMPDCYKEEFINASDWLRFGFHARQEFPDYPYVNASYEQVKADLDEMKKEVFRFAGEKSFVHSVVTHWNPISKEGCRALYDGGIRVMTVTSGPTREYEGDPSVLPYGHAARLLHNRKPETKLYKRGTRNVAIDSSICGYNHLPDEVLLPYRYGFDYYVDNETGMGFKSHCTGPTLNLTPLDEIEEEMIEKNLGSEFFGYATHEQYFYPDYYAYQSDYAERIYKAAETVQKNGYEYFFIEEIIK